MLRKILLPVLVLAAMNVLLPAAEKNSIEMYPQAKEGYVRYAIVVPKTENDADHRVELLIGKTRLVDCNRRSYHGTIEEVTLKGWGYSYLEVKDISEGPTTMMACRKPKSERFISLYAPEQTMRRYNSRLPLVVYVPRGFEVKYRIWSASEALLQAEEK